MKQQAEVRQLKAGSYVIIDDEPCEIVSMSTSKPGKHGAAKARIDAIGIFDGQRRSIVQPVTSKTYIPIVERKRAQVMTVTGGVAHLMDLETYETFELTVPDSVADRVKEGKEIVYIESLGKRKIAEK
jgi:translation initiation factor 5A